MKGNELRHGRSPGHPGGNSNYGGDNQPGHSADRSRSANDQAKSDRRAEQKAGRDRRAAERSLNGRGDAGYRAEQARAAKLEAERRKNAAEEAERKRKEQERLNRFKRHRDDAADRKQRILLGELEDFEQGQINKSLTSMKKYKNQSGVAKWDIQEVADRPAYGLSRIAAIREGLINDEETYNGYLGALKSELASKKYNVNLLDATDPANKGKYFSGDLMNGFRLISANI